MKTLTTFSKTCLLFKHLKTLKLKKNSIQYSFFSKTKFSNSNYSIFYIYKHLKRCWMTKVKHNLNLLYFLFINTQVDKQYVVKIC